MARWRPGQSGNLRGRPRGSRNKATAEIREILDSSVDFQAVVKKLFQRAKKGNERAAALLLEYRYGRPRAVDELTLRTETAKVQADLSNLTGEELQEELIQR